MGAKTGLSEGSIIIQGGVPVVSATKIQIGANSPIQMSLQDENLSLISLSIPNFGDINTTPLVRQCTQSRHVHLSPTHRTARPDTNHKMSDTPGAGKETCAVADTEHHPTCTVLFCTVFSLLVLIYSHHTIPTSRGPVPSHPAPHCTMRGTVLFSTRHRDGCVALWVTVLSCLCTY